MLALGPFNATFQMLALGPLHGTGTVECVQEDACPVTSDDPLRRWLAKMGAFGALAYIHRDKLERLADILGIKR